MKGLSKMFVAGLVCMAVWGVCAAARAEEKTYTNRLFGYSIRYPSDFEFKPIGDIITFASKKTDKKFQFAHNLNIMAGSLGVKASVLDDFYRVSKERLEKNLVSVEIVEEKNGKVAGQPSKRMVYLSRQKQATFKVLQEMFIYNGRVYVLTFTDLAEGFNAHVNQAERMIRTFKVFN